MLETQVFTIDFILRLIINIVAMVILIRFIYFKTYNRRESFFTFFMLNFIIFLMSYILEITGGFAQIGSAFGLLAAFTLLRFRTESITMKDMTYLFIIMTIGLINSIMKGTYLEIIGLNLLIVIVVYIIDGGKILKNQKFQTIEYDKLENIKPDNRETLISELKEITGLNIQKISIKHIDVGKQKAMITIYYYDN